MEDAAVAGRLDGRGDDPYSDEPEEDRKALGELLSLLDAG